MTDDNNTGVTLASVLPEREFDLWNFLKKEFPARGNFRILYSIQPSALARLSSKDRQEKEAYFDGEIQFLVVSQKESSDALLAVVHTLPYHGPAVIKWLRSKGLSVVEVSDAISPFQIRTTISELKANGVNPAPGLKPIGNRWEADITRSTQIATRVRHRRSRDSDIDEMFKEYYKRNPAQFHVFQEFPVHKAINVRPNYAPGSGLWEYAGRARFDVLVTTLPPNATPRLAIEFDGRWHDEPESAEPDRKKNELCRLSGLPMLRIHYSDWPFETNVVSIDRTTSNKDEVGKQLVDFVLHAIVTKIEPDRISENEQKRGASSWRQGLRNSKIR